MRFSSPSIGLILTLAATPTCFGQSFGASGLGAHGHGGGGVFGPSGISGETPGGSRAGFGGGYASGLGAAGYGGYAVGYPYYFATPYFAGPSLPPIVPNAVGAPLGGGGFGGLMLPTPRARLANGTNIPRRSNPSRAKEFVEVGDRSFRSGNIHRAEERYHLAAKADATSPIPRVHLAQVSLVRGDYAAAADQLRAAVAVAHGSGWLINAPDVQAMFAEPADYARHIAKLESHLQAHPADRDAWFVLGAEHYFSGRTQASNDAFARLTDRKPDEALAAFLDVAKP